MTQEDNTDTIPPPTTKTQSALALGNKNSNNFTLIGQSIDIQGEENFTQGCKFSPDGSCILTCTASDHTFRLYNTSDASVYTYDNNSDDEKNENSSNGNNIGSSSEGNSSSEDTPKFKSALNIQEGDAIRAYEWYPFMKSNDANSSVFISSARDQPLHLFDAYTGKIRCSYRAYDAVDAIESAQTVTFTPDGQRIVAGYNRYLKMFYTGMPGREYDTLRLGKSRYSKDGQKGIVSCVSFRDADLGFPHVFAVGTYAGSVYLYDDRIPGSIAADIIIQGTCVIGHGKNNRRKKKRKFEKSNDEIFSAAKEKWFEKTVSGGVTQLTWSSDNNYLFSAARRSDQVVSWDMRCLTSQDAVEIKGVASYSRSGGTNQHVAFDLNDKTLFLGSCDGTVKIYDVTTGNCDKVITCNDAVNGVSYARDYGLLSVSTGCRKFRNAFEDEDDNNYEIVDDLDIPGSLSLYRHTF